MLKLIFFDFDGVIVESTGIKTEAFRKLFSDRPAHVDEIVAYHKEKEGVSRFEKFRYIYAHILHEDLTGEKEEELGRRFSELVLEGVKRCPLVPGTIEFLEGYHKKLPLFVVSATPDQELKDIISERGLGRFFRGVFGSPASKADVMKRTISQMGLKGKDALFVGDTLSDYRHSLEAGVRFVGREIGDRKPFPSDTITIKDLRGLGRVVDSQ
jgi:phosphoglycolate phosphatase-like HAD superfamily hydrolase